MGIWSSQCCAKLVDFWSKIGRRNQVTMNDVCQLLYWFASVKKFLWNNTSGGGERGRVGVWIIESEMRFWPRQAVAGIRLWRAESAGLRGQTSQPVSCHLPEADQLPASCLFLASLTMIWRWCETMAVAQNWVMLISEQHRYQGVSYKSDIIVVSGNFLRPWSIHTRFKIPT